MSYKIKILTKSPIHIGSGKTIGLSELKNFSNYIYRLNIDKCFHYVLDRIGSDGLDKLNQWAEEKSAEIDTYGQTKAQKEYEIDVFNFVEKFLKNKELSDELKDKVINDKEFILYKIESKTKIEKTVSEIIKTAKNELYIPGSSIKGLIRTALATQYFLSNTDWGWLKDVLVKLNNDLEEKIRKDRNIRDSYKKIDDKIQEKIFKCGYEKYENGKTITKYNDEKYDLMKFIHISDTDTKKIEEGGQIIKPQLYLTKGKKQGQLNIYEVIKSGQNFEARLNIDTDYLLALKSQLPTIKYTKGNTIWINLEEKFKKLFDVELKELNKSNKEEFERKIIENINKGILSLSKSVKKKEAKIPNNKIDYFHLNLEENAVKLGWASQFYGTTLFEILANSIEKDFSENPIPKELKTVKEIYLKILNRLKTSKKEIKDSCDFPVSRRYNEISQNKLEAIGWVTLNFEAK